MSEKKLIHPDKPDLIIKNILSKEECLFYRRMTDEFAEDKSPIVALRRNKKGLYEVDRQYWTFREHPTWMIDLTKKLTKYYGENIYTPRHWHIMKYRRPGDGLGWHAEGRISYVSFSVNLSDPNEHEGADFEVWNRDVTLNQGDGIAYSGKTTHQVSPLVSGTKYSIVAWFKDKGRMKEIYEKPFPYDKERKA
tara:strand:- start:101 stop:679 length:579 start_codon:yes stop_codon:yes gene_type:complete